MRTFHNFKTVEGFQKFLRSSKYPKCHTCGCLDYVNVDSVLFTMHEYDMSGRTITWANKKYRIMLELTTFDRYKNGYNDARVYKLFASYLRNDINYAQ